MSQTVYLGMSGGVDSALSAALLCEQGYDVHAIYMRNWSRDLPGFKCTWAADLADAERVAVTLGIDLDVWDCEAEYKTTVVDYLVDSYARGYTPNPDVMCNQTVKFGTFAQRAFADGADLIATGHYARTQHATDPARPARLLRAADEHKDQTYFLWRVPGQTFNRVLFPVGDIPSKAVVRQMCAERGLGIERKPDSDGICFVGEVGIRTFLLDVLDRKAGDIVEWETGKVLGRHDGAFLYTIGQRKGLNLGGGPARYVVRTDTQDNVVYVSANHDCPALLTTELVLEDCHWLAGHAPVARNTLAGQAPAGQAPADRAPASGQTPLAQAIAAIPGAVKASADGQTPVAGDYVVRTRHTGALVPARVEPLPNGQARVSFDTPQRLVAPGQSCVVYDGLECVGGGIVCPDTRPHPRW